MRRGLGYGTFNPGMDAMPDTSMPPQWQVELDAIAPTISDKVAEQSTGGEAWYETLARTLPILTATYQQKQILDVQVERAKQGLPPLNASQFAAGVSVGASPELTKTLLIGAALVAAALFMGRRA